MASKLSVQEQSEKAKEALARLHESVTTMTTDADWTEYLKVLVKFHNYSPRNIMWMWCQWEARREFTAWMNVVTGGAIEPLPEFSQPAGYSTWPDLKRNVKGGEKGLSVLAPIIVKDREHLKADGTPKDKLIGWKLVSRTFDVSQTEGEPLPESPIVCERLQGAAPAGVIAALTAMADAYGFGVTFGPIMSHPDAHGVCNFTTKTITVRADLSEAQQAKTLTHEIAHAIMHGPTARYDLPSIETEAESVAYVVMDALGVVADTYSIGYVASWSKGDGELIAKTAERVLKAAQAILTALDDPTVTLAHIGPSKEQKADEDRPDVELAA